MKEYILLDVEVEGILFNPIPPETVSFDVIVEANAQPITPPDNGKINTNRFTSTLRTNGNIEEIESGRFTDV